MLVFLLSSPLGDLRAGLFPLFSSKWQVIVTEIVGLSEGPGASKSVNGGCQMVMVVRQNKRY